MFVSINKTEHIGDWKSSKQGNSQPLIIHGWVKDKV